MTEQGTQGGQGVVVPILQELLEPGSAGPPNTFDRPVAGRGEPDPRSSAVGGIVLANDHPVALELLDFTSDGRGVDSKYLGKVGDPEGIALRRELEKEGGSSPVESDACLSQEPLVQTHLGNRPGDVLQRLIELVDVVGCRARLGNRPDSCFRHTNIVDAVRWQ